MAIAAVHALCWAVVTPPFQTPDEINHAGYVQYLAETGNLPSGDVVEYSDEQDWITGHLPHGIEARPTWWPPHARELFDGLRRPGLDRSNPGEAGNMVNYPPLYYAVEVVPYRAGYDLVFLDRLFLMRLGSVLMAALTVGFVFLFLRELLPRTPWAWTVGALAVAFQPVFAFIAGGVNNDNLLFTCAAALFFLVARAFRRGLDLRLGVVIGVVAAAGFLSKQSIVGLFPGAALALAWMVWRTPRARVRAAHGAGAAAAVALVPAMLWAFASSQLVGRPADSIVGGITNAANDRVTSWPEQVSYAWQVFLPPLPFMQDHVPHLVFWEAYVRGFIGIFGWFESAFQPWAYVLGASLLGVLLVLALCGLIRGRAALRARWFELVVYATMAAGLVAVVEVSAYRFWALTGQFFEQARYLFPLLALYGAVVALAARGAGARWGPPVGAFIVVMLMGHSLLSMLHVVARFYA